MSRHRYTVWIQTAALRTRYEPLLRTLPRYFDLAPIETGTPPVTVLGHTGNATDRVWDDFELPIYRGTLYLYEKTIAGSALGGACPGRAGIRITDDPDEVLALRIWHELLHAEDQPADDMHALVTAWLPDSKDRLTFQIRRLLGTADVPVYHREFYAYLTRRAIGAQTYP